MDSKTPLRPGPHPYRVQREESENTVKWNSPFYGIEGQGWFLSFHCLTRYVKVTFFRYVTASTPPGESKHEELRYLDIHEDD